MRAHEKRVAEELKELQERRDKLIVFIGSNSMFASLPEGEQGRMKRQLGYMEDYIRVLAERIANFPKAEGR